MVRALIGMNSLPRADASDALAVAITHGRTVRVTAARLVPALTVRVTAPRVVRRGRT